MPAHQELAKVEAQTGEYAPGTVTPTTPGAEDSDAAESENGDVAPEQAAAQTVADQAEETPAEPVATQHYEEGRAPAA